jgi:hypothetical protein
MIEVEPNGALKIQEIEAHGEDAPVVHRPAVQGGELDRAFAAARERGRLRVAEILSGPKMLSADNLAQMLGRPRATINTKRQSRQLLAIESVTRGVRFSSWQIAEDDKRFAALPQLFELLGDHPWAVYRFLVQSYPQLEGAMARDAHRRGRLAEVVQTAASFTDAFAEYCNCGVRDPRQKVCRH